MESKIYLYIFSKKLNAENISDILGIKYHKKINIGDRKSEKSKLIYDENIWILESRLSEELNLNDAIESLLFFLKGKDKELLNLHKQCELQCSVVINSEIAPELNFKSTLLEALGHFGFNLDIDLY